MNNKSRFTGSVLAALTVVMMLAVPVAGNAQETTSSIRGKVLDAGGSGVANASVVVLDMRSGVERSFTTNDSGLFLATRLLPGGPYRVTVNNSETVQVGSINVGDIYSLTVTMDDSPIEEIVATGKVGDRADVATGPTATFNLADLENSVSFGRDISDVYGIDPRLMVDVDEDGVGINCGGKHPRFNSTTLDGVDMGDRFGLNENGYATAVGMPFPYDAIEQVAVELAPFDVTYGGFSACIINSVTKSGTNDWEAKGFYEFSNQDFRGDTVADDTSDHSRSGYDKTYYGFNVGGPIIKDKLFVFAAYEQTDEPRFLAKGYNGQGSGEERDWLSQADYNRIVAIATSPTYNYDPGGSGGDGVQETEKYLVRVDWNINENHNAAFIYNYFDGFQDRDSDGDDFEFEFANHYYVKGAESDTKTFKLSSQWTDAFSTELFYSNSEMNDSQVTVGEKDFADTQISVGRDVVYLGADDSRQANSLSTETEYLKLSGSFLAGDHVISAGFESQTVDIFNIFVQHSRGGEYDYFDDSGSNDAACSALTAQGRHDSLDPDCGTSGIDKFELGRPSRIFYGSAGETNNALDAAAVFGNTMYSLYVQDEIFVDDQDLTITVGLRYDWFDSSDRPKFHQNFFDASGMRNDGNIDGIDLIMPRLGFTWGATDTLTLRGGVGLYSGGNPNVWLSNAWSNDGITNVQLGGFSGWDEEDFFPDGLDGDPTTDDPADSFTVLPGSIDSIQLSGSGTPNRDIPQQQIDAVAASTALTASPRGIVLIDPNYEQPSEWKFAIGGTWDMPWYEMTLDFDYMHTRGNDPAHYIDVSQMIVGQTLAGSPIYDYFTSDSSGTEARDNLMLTNSPSSPTSDMISFVLAKDWDWGLSAQLGYAWVEGDDLASMVASTAGSNFTAEALTDINQTGPSTSNWVVPQRVTIGLFYENNLFGNSATRFSLQGYYNEGQSQSYVMDSGDFEGDGFNGRHLLYVPTGPNDPNVNFLWDDRNSTNPTMHDDFFAFIAREGLAPGFQTRNATHTGWSNVWHFSVRQEIPLGERMFGNVYLKVKNIGNLLNDDWGKVTDSQYFPVEVIRDTDILADGRIQFEEFRDSSLQRTYVNPSLWEVRMGIDIQFGQ